jgi:hypothetical protein
VDKFDPISLLKTGLVESLSERRETMLECVDLRSRLLVSPSWPRICTPMLQVKSAKQTLSSQADQIALLECLI